MQLVGSAIAKETNTRLVADSRARMRVSTLQRFIAYSLFGCLLLLIYQFVFMARTSANRDWNHLHNNKFTLPSLQKFTVDNIEKENVSEELDWFSTSKLSVDAALLQNVAADQAQLHPNAVFALSSEQKFDLHIEDIWVCAADAEVSIANEIERAKHANKRAMVYLVPPHWVPNFGLTVLDFPIILATNFTNVQNVQLSFAYSNSRTEEWTVPGYTRETVLIGASDNSAASVQTFNRIAFLVRKLTSRGWKPLRSIHFVRFPRYTASQWALKHKSWIAQRGIAYIDTSQIAGSNGSQIWASPSLKQLSLWAAFQLFDAGLISEPFHDQTAAAPLGAASFLTEHALPSVGASFDDAQQHARVLALIAVTLAQDAVLPFHMMGYSNLHLLDSPNYNQTAAAFDSAVSALRDSFTTEYPWYQFSAKFRALAQRKRLNLIMSKSEQQLEDKNSGLHAVFACNSNGSGIYVLEDSITKQDATARLISHLDF